MKFLLILLASLSVSVSAVASQGARLASRYQCACFQNVPFEGYIIYVIEKYQGQESWLTLEAAPTNYDSETECQAAIQVNKTCDELSRM